MRIVIQDYEIERASREETVTKPLHFRCVSYVLRINRIIKADQKHDVGRKVMRSGGEA